MNLILGRELGLGCSYAMSLYDLDLTFNLVLGLMARPTQEK